MSTPSYRPLSSLSIYLPTTQIFPTDDPTKLANSLNQSINQIANNINVREIAIYNIIENQDGQQWYTPGNPQKFRYNYRLIIPINEDLLNAPQPIDATGIISFTNIYGSLTDDTNWYSNGYYDGTDYIGVQCTTTTYTIYTSLPITGGNLILEYLKN